MSSILDPSKCFDRLSKTSSACVIGKRTCITSSEINVPYAFQSLLVKKILLLSNMGLISVIIFLFFKQVVQTNHYLFVKWKE